MRIVLAIHDPPTWTLPTAEVARIRASLPDAEILDTRTPDERRAAFPDADVLVTTGLRRDEPPLLARVRWIHSTAVGVDGLLRPGLAERGVVVTNSRGIHADPIAEHAIALTLALRRGLHIAGRRQVARTWAQEELAARRTEPLGRTTMVVVGLGEIGSRVARLAHGLGMRVIGVRRRPDEPVPPGVDQVRGADALHPALAEADVVVLALPMTPGTGTLLDRDALAAMRPTAILINVARGALVDPEALVEALRAGRLGGAGLDAFTREPLASDSPLWDLPNVLITPHSASFQGDYWGPVVDLLLDNVGRFSRGDALRNVVDPEHGY
ncbi:MAG TPA: D-2-hydroxyacid dehydrogenase [Vicinamibacterales bacterium]|nr:D-2-hydroxyacid dehydrogenase [Vicinamibacterales bacterium]